MASGVQEDLLSLQKKLTVGDASLSLKRHVEELQQKYESKVAQASGCDLKDSTLMKEDSIGSALIPKDEVGEEIKALNSTADGNCLFNSASNLLVRDQSASHMLRFLTAVELFLNPQYYANHLKLTESKTSSRFSDTTKNHSTVYLKPLCGAVPVSNNCDTFSVLKCWMGASVKQVPGACADSCTVFSL